MELQNKYTECLRMNQKLREKEDEQQLGRKVASPLSLEATSVHSFAFACI